MELQKLPTVFFQLQFTTEQNCMASGTLQWVLCDVLPLRKFPRGYAELSCCWKGWGFFFVFLIIKSAWRAVGNLTVEHCVFGVGEVACSKICKLCLSQHLVYPILASFGWMEETSFTLGESCMVSLYYKQGMEQQGKRERDSKTAVHHWLCWRVTEEQPNCRAVTSWLSHCCTTWPTGGSWPKNQKSKPAPGKDVSILGTHILRERQQGWSALGQMRL